jgi:3-dehydroquinate dehydratase-2
MKIYIINGPNLNMLGIREPEIYGKCGYDTLVSTVREFCETKGVEPVFYQSNQTDRDSLSSRPGLCLRR